MRNTLSDYEVSLIKCLIDQKTYSNQEIVGLINRHRGDPKDDINSGRISNIKNNQILKYSSIDPCNEEELRKFLSEVKSKSTNKQSMVSAAILVTLLPIVSSDPSKFNITETDRIECKESFSYPLKTIAAFANNKGGYFFFGIKNKTWDILGLNEQNLKKFKEHDLNTINQKIRSTLGIDLQIQKNIYCADGKTLGILYIPPAHTKPLIFTKSHNEDGTAVTEGHIYYRYSGEDRLISPTDLQHIIEERIQQLSETILSKHISKILQVGPKNVAILDTNTGMVDGSSGNFLIDENLLSEITFIKEGKLNEKEGAPTLKVIGEVVPLDKTEVEKVVKEPIIDTYPLSARQLSQEVRKRLPKIKQHDVWNAIRENDIKGNSAFSAYNFRSKNNEKQCRKNEKRLSAVPCIYNWPAVEYLVNVLQ